LGDSVISAGTIHDLRRVKVPGTGPLSLDTIVGHICLIFLDKNMYTEKHLIELFNDHDYI
jgi:hypothetical protein